MRIRLSTGRYGSDIGWRIPHDEATAARLRELAAQLA